MLKFDFTVDQGGKKETVHYVLPTKDGNAAITLSLELAELVFLLLLFATFSASFSLVVWTLQQIIVMWFLRFPIIVNAGNKRQNGHNLTFILLVGWLSQRS